MSATIFHMPIDSFGQPTGGSLLPIPQKRSWYFADWKVILRPKYPKLIEGLLTASLDIMNNNNLHFSYKSNNNISTVLNDKSTVSLTELQGTYYCDDTNLIHLLLRSAGSTIKYLNRESFMNTLMTSSLFLKLSNNLNTSTYLEAGDIIVSDSHLALIVDNNDIFVSSIKAPKNKVIGVLEYSKNTAFYSHANTASSINYLSVAHGEMQVINIHNNWYYGYYYNDNSEQLGYVYVNPSSMTYTPTNQAIVTNYKAEGKKLPITIFKNPLITTPFKKINAQLTYTIIEENNGFGKISSGLGWVKLTDIKKIISKEE